MHCPKQVAIEAVCIDGKLAVFDVRDPRRPTLRLDAAPSAHVIVLSWVCPPGEALPDFGFAQTVHPRLDNNEVERDICTIVPPAGRSLVARKGLVRLDAPSAWLSRLEGLVAVMWDSSHDDASHAALWQLVIATRSVCAEQLKLLGNTRDRKGRPLTVKLQGEVVPYLREPAKEG